MAGDGKSAAGAGGRPPRGVVGLVLKLPLPTLEEFAGRYGADLRRGAFPLKTKNPKPPGTAVSFDLRLAGGQTVLRGSGVIRSAPSEGVEVAFIKLDEASQVLVECIRAGTPLPPLAAAAPPPPPPAAKPAPAEAPPPPPASPPPPPPPVLSKVEGSKVEGVKKQNIIIGIDLGTTNSCAAVVQKEKPFVISSREGYNTIPSIVAVNEKNKLLIGHPAKGQMLTNPRNTIYGAKRLVGRAFNSATVQQIASRFHYEIVEGPNGEAAVQVAGRTFSLQEVSGLVLKEVKDLAQTQLGEEVNRAVITVPAYYNDNQRQAVREAGKLAGLTVERILNEPTAAALAFGYGRGLDQRILVYDLGGGTFDASVLELRGNVYEVVSTGGDTFLGGVDFDTKIVNFVIEDFKKRTGQEFTFDRVALQRIADAAERAKCLLSEQLEARILVPFVTMVHDRPYDIDLTLTRSQLYELTGDLVKRTVEVCGEVLAARGLTPKDIDDVLLVGGQSRMPLVHQRITEYFAKPPSKQVHPDEAVALGAALLAESLAHDRLDSVVLIDVLPMSIGIGLPGNRFKRIIERNTSLPHTKGYQLSTFKDDQKELELSLFQGESERATDNEFLGTLHITDLPPGPRGSVKLAVSFALGAECLLKVSAKNMESGQVTEVTLTTRDTPEAIKARLAEEGEAEPKAAEKPRPAEAPRKGFFGRLFGKV